jgi:uncharacterized alpha-E superfamily protein
MYRKHRRLRINSGDVLDYSLKDPDFPRSVAHCVNEIATCFHRLQKSDVLNDNLKALAASLQMTDIHQFTPVQLHELLDGIQIKLNITHKQIASTWFLPAS